MLGPARDIDLGMPDQRREHPADEGARVTCGGDIGIVEHGMAVTPQPPVVAGFGLSQQSNKPPAVWPRRPGPPLEIESLQSNTPRVPADSIVPKRKVAC